MISRILHRLRHATRPPDTPAARAARAVREIEASRDTTWASLRPWLVAAGDRGRGALRRWFARPGTLASLGEAGAAHATDEEILCLVDGELPEREAARVLRHLDTCWTCRHRRTRVQGTIDAFMESVTDGLSRDEGLFDVSRLPRAAVTVLHAAPSHGRSPLSFSLPFPFGLARMASASAWRRLLPSGAIAVRIGAACGTAWLIVFLSAGGPVSARQLVRQVDRAERAALDLSPSPVVYQRLQVARRGVAGGAGGLSSGTWDVWTDVSRRQHRSVRVPTDARGEGLGGHDGAAVGTHDAAGVAGAGHGADVRDGAMLARESRRGESHKGESRIRESRTGDSRSDAADALPDALFGLLQAHGGGDAWPVSLRSHQHWRARARAARDAVIPARTATGEAALLLDTTSDSGLDVGVSDGGDGGGDRGDVGRGGRGSEGVATGVESGADDEGRGTHDGRGTAASAGVGTHAGTGASTRANMGSAAGVDSIIRATLLVRERDWHPIEQRLIVREDGMTTEFVIHEAGFEIVPRASLPVAFFDGDGSNRRHVLELPAPDPEPARPATPAAADLVTAEVEAMYALHRVGMTAADEIAVHRRQRNVDVIGLTTTDERRRTLMAALAPIPLVRARIRTADEVLADIARDPVTTESGAVRFDGAQFEADRLPVQALAAPMASAGASVPLAPGAGSKASSPDAPSAAAPFAAGAASAILAPPLPSPAATADADTAATAARTRPASPSATTSVPAASDAATDRANATAAAASSGRADQATMRHAREAVQQSLTLLERAWALRRLAEWSRRTSPRDVTASTRALIEVMLRERAAAASSALAALDTTVSAALPPRPTAPAPTSSTPLPPEVAPGAGASASAAPPSTAAATTTATTTATAAAEERPWTDIATDFFGAAAEIDRDTRRLFTASPADSADGAGSRPADDARRLRRGLDAAARFLDALHRARH